MAAPSTVDRYMGVSYRGIHYMGVTLQQEDRSEQLEDSPQQQLQRQ